MKDCRVSPIQTRKTVEMERTEAGYGGRMPEVQWIGKMILDVVHGPIHPGGIFPARGC
jgi:hypothetical protein